MSGNIKNMTSTASDFASRLVEENEQLEERINKLTYALNHKIEPTKTQRMLLEVQLKAMETYHKCLELRMFDLKEQIEIEIS